MNNQYLYGFLEAYADFLGWNELETPPKGFEAIARKLCEEYHYSPVLSREFLMLAYGWTWGRTNNELEGRSLSYLLKTELDKVYEVVAKENDWY